MLCEIDSSHGPTFRETTKCEACYREVFERLTVPASPGHTKATTKKVSGRALTEDERVERYAALIGRKVAEASGPVADLPTLVGLTAGSPMFRKALDEADASGYVVTLTDGRVASGPEDAPQFMSAMGQVEPRVDPLIAALPEVAKVIETGPWPVLQSKLGAHVEGDHAQYACERAAKRLVAEGKAFATGKRGPQALRGLWPSESAWSALND